MFRAPRRLGGLALCGLLIAGGASLGAQNRSWAFSAYSTAMTGSGRDAGAFTESTFETAQARKQKYLDEIQSMLVRNFGAADPLVMQAFQAVPREYYMYNYESGHNMAQSAYEVPAQEWKIGYGSVLTDYIMQAYMTARAHPKPTDVSLEVGTGSGFQSSILSRIVKKAYTIEIITSLGDKVKNIFSPLGLDNVEARVGDGFFGWPEVEGGFDIILVTAQAPFVPPALLAQLKKGGRMIVPIGQPWKPQYLYVFTKDEQGKVHSQRDVATLFIPMTGQIQTPPPRPSN
ncbi:MAG TPA: protein-L-isoaspartate O-methyltransferase [Spirochaetia bacterium]|nr:protein-L-isoaspartate O-methyltransferase [Spirochaetia bacterium]